jgi:hypothetical protein
MTEKMLCHVKYMPYLELLDWDFGVSAANRCKKLEFLSSFAYEYGNRYIL